MATITSLMFRMNSTYNGDGLAQARRDISRLDGSMNALDKSSSALVPGFKALVSTMIMLGPALVPITGGLLGVGAAAGSAFASAGGAVALYAVALKGAINATIGTGSAFKDTNQAITKAQKALDDAVPGTKAYAKAEEDLAAAQKAHQQAIKDLPATQENFARAYDLSRVAVSRFNDENAKFILGPATTMVEAFTAALPKMTGVLKAVNPEIQRVADLTKKWVTGGGLQRFLDYLIKYGVPALHGFIDAGRSLFAALGQGMRDMAPLGQSFVDWLSKTMDAFKNWAEGGGFQRFLKWLTDNKDTLIGMAKDLGQFMGNLGKALGDMSGLALTNVGVLLKILASFPPGLIEALAYAWVAWNAALTVYNVVAFISAAATTAMTLAATPFALLIAGMALTILGVVAALVALGVGIFFLVKYWDTVWGAIKDSAKAVWGWMKDTWDTIWGGIKDAAVAVWDFLTKGWGQFLLLFMGPIGLIIAVAAHWDQIWNTIKDVATTVWDALKTAWSATVDWLKSVWDSFSQPIMDSWNTIWPQLQEAATNVWNFLKTAWNLLWISVKAVWDAYWAVFGPAWKGAWDGLSAIAGAAWDILKGAWQVLWSVIMGIWNVFYAALSGAFKIGWAVVTGTAQTAWAILSGAWQVLWSVIMGIWNVFYAALSGIFSTAWNTIVAIATGIWNIIKAAWDVLWKTVTAIFVTFLAIFTGNWSKAWQTIQALGQAIWNLISTAWSAFLGVLSALFSGFANTIKGVWTAFWNAVVSIATTFWNALRGVFQTALTALQALWNAVWNAIRTFFQTLTAAVVSIATTFWNTLRSAFQTGLSAVQSVWNSVWTAIRNFFSTIKDGVISVVNVLWTSIRAVFTTGSDWLRTTFWNPVSNFFTKTIPSAFKSGADALGKAWDGIKKLVRDPIQAVVNVVYNNGIVSLWNAVAGVFGAKKLSKFTLPAFAQGGPTGNGSANGFPAIVHPGEHVWTSAEVKAMGGHDQVAALRAMALGRKGMNAVRVMGGPNGRYDDGGGIFGTGIGPKVGPDLVPDGIVKNVIGKLKDVVLGGVYKVIEGPINAAVKAAQAAVRGLTPAGSGIRDLGEAIPKKIGDTVLAWIKGKDVAPAGTGGTMVGAIPKGDHLKIINAALKAAGVPPPGTLAQWQKGLNTLITRESGWNPNAQNNWDSNAAAGMASRGLAQVIPPTFASNHVPGTSNNIFDPVANVAAAIRYITRRYGNITNVQQANASLPPKGYANGTPGANSGWATVGERGLERVRFRGGERVDPMRNLINDVRGGGDTHVQVDIDARGATVAAVDKLHREFPDTLRIALAQGVGKNS